MIKVFSSLIIILFLACQPVKKGDFDGNSMIKLVQQQVDFGARLNNSPAKEKCLLWIKSLAEDQGLAVEIDRWSEIIEGKERKFANLIITKAGEDKMGEFVIAASHYDTKEIKTQPHFVGANDGGSSTAVLIAIMQKLSKWKSHKTIKFVFFDGEECFGHQYRRAFQEGGLNGLHGSSHYASQLLYSGSLKQCRAFLLMDMIGDKDLNISFPQNNSQKLVSKAMKIAKEMKVEKYFSNFKSSILDDHVPFFELGVETINFIDFDYGVNNKYWHTNADTVDKLSSRSLEITARIFTKLLKDLAR